MAASQTALEELFSMVATCSRKQAKAVENMIIDTIRESQSPYMREKWTRTSRVVNGVFALRWDDWDKESPIQAADRKMLAKTAA